MVRIEMFHEETTEALIKAIYKYIKNSYAEDKAKGVSFYYEPVSISMVGNATIVIFKRIVTIEE